MKLLLTAYIYNESTVVTDKSVVKNATDEEFRVVNLILTSDEIRDFYENWDIGSEGESA